MKLLLVEDDASLRLLLEQLLQRFGHQVFTAADAEAAWELSLNQAFDFAIVDWVLPGMSGLELCQRLRARPGGEYLYLWVITARNRREDLLEALAAGANDYLAKPIEIPLLEVRVRIAEQQARQFQQRRVAEAALAEHQAVLEQRVQERTEELSRLIQTLQDEINQRRTAEALLESTRDQLRALASRLLSIQEEQQKRISREIHDELGQAMTALKIDLVWLQGQLAERPDLQQKIQQMVPLISVTIATIQRICAELRPGILDDLGLEAALEWLVQEFSTRSGLNCQLRVTPEELDLPAALATTLFRICQEALTNVLRHAGARSVRLRLERVGADVSLRISDDGKGIDMACIAHPMSLGLMGMRERLLPFNGAVAITGGPGLGTTIQVNVTLEDSHDTHSDRR